MCKTIAIYNQTFIKMEGTKDYINCAFNRIMKHKPNQFFILKASVARLESAEDRGLIFLKDLAIVNMKCNVKDDDNDESNHWFLGSLADAGHNYEMKLDDIPLDGFKIYNDTTNNDFVVNFQIELRED